MNMIRISTWVRNVWEWSVLIHGRLCYNDMGTVMDAKDQHYTRTSARTSLAGEWTLWNRGGEDVQIGNAKSSASPFQTNIIDRRSCSNHNKLVGEKWTAHSHQVEKAPPCRATGTTIACVLTGGLRWGRRASPASIQSAEQFAFFFTQS
jgi:hypothetical protein